MPSRSRSPHSHSPSPKISRRSPVLRGRMRSPDRHRMVTDSSRPHRSSDFRTTSVRSRSPIEKTRSLSPPVKRKLSPKRIRENLKRLPPQPPRKLSRSKSPGSSPHSSVYKASLKRSDSTDRSRSGSRENDRKDFRGPDKFDINELKKIAVDIKRIQGVTTEKCTTLNRAITNPDEITIVRRPDEGSRPIFMREEIIAAMEDRSRGEPIDEYRRIVAIDPEKSSERSRNEKPLEHSQDSSRNSPTHYEASSRSYYSNEPRVRSQSPSYSTSKHSPTRNKYYVGPEKERVDRPSSSKNDLHHELDYHRREDRHYSERHSSYDREKERVTEKRSESHHRHEDRHHERERRRSVRTLSPSRERRRGSTERVHPSRGGSWDRDHERENRLEKRKRTRSKSRERESGRTRGSGRERYEESNEVEERPRRYSSSYRGYFQDPSEYIPVSIRGRGIPVPIRRGLPGPQIFRGRPIIRAAPRIFRGVPFVRGLPPRVPFIPIRGGFIPRFYPPF